jgi:DNA-binding MarR family transcriptional regulator
VVDRKAGLSPERLSLLSVLVYARPRTFSQLADAEQVSRPAISRSVKALVRDRLVRRERDTSDRRSVTVHATARGRRLMEAARRRRLERIAADFEDLDRDQLAALRRATDILHSLASAPISKGTE